MKTNTKQGRRFWTKSELYIIKQKYAVTPTEQLARKLNRPVGAVYQAAGQLGLKRDKSYLVELAKNLAEAGKANRFKKGQTPLNKGRKQTEYMSAEAIERTSATRFKKGSIPHNTKNADGIISIRKDKKGGLYQYIRLGLGKWELLQRVEWEKHNGKIPDQMIIVFKDGNALNCVIENLLMITRAEHLERNQDKHNKYDPETKTAIKLINKITKKVNNYGKQQQQS